MRAAKIKMPLNMTVTLRSAMEDDAKKLLQFLDAVLTHGEGLIAYPDERKISVHEEKKFLKKITESKNDVFVIAEFEDRIIGCVDVRTPPRRKRAHVGALGMAVLPEWRSRGIGKALLKTVLEWCKKQKGLEKITVSVRADNPRALHLYEKYGFKEEGRKVKELKIDSEHYVDDVLLSKFV